MSKDKTCCFSGHRPGKLPFGYNEEHSGCLRLRVSLIGVIDYMRLNGVTTFLSGMAMGSDMIAAEAVLDMRRAYPGIRLVAVQPYEGQANRWTEKYRERYFNILAKADEVITLQRRYTAACFRERNRYMVDASAHLVAVYNGAAGGTRYTVDYAVQQGLDVIVINPETLKRERLGQKKPRETCAKRYAQG